MNPIDYLDQSLRKLKTTLYLAKKYYLKPCYYDGPVRQNDFPQHFMTVNLEAYEKMVHECQVGDVKVLDQIVYEKQPLPILQIDWQGNEATNKVLILAGVHGNETGGVLAIPELLRHIRRAPDLYKTINFRIITPVNPVGVAFQSRHNENGCDLNRNFFRSKERGVILQRKVIETFGPDLIINLHEAPSQGFLIHPNEYISDLVVAKILEATKEEGVVLAAKDYWGRPLKQMGCSRVNGSMAWLSRIFNIQSLDRYAVDRKIPIVTTESGWDSEDKLQRITAHLHCINAIIEHQIT